MKRIVLTALMSMPFLVWAQSDTFNLKGKIANPKKGARAYLVHMVMGVGKVDSTEVKNGVFSFSGEVPVPTYAILKLSHPGNRGAVPDSYTLYLDKGEILISAKDSVKYASISGAKSSVDYVKYKKLTTAQDESLASLDKEWVAGTEEEKKDGSLAARLKEKSKPFRDEKRRIQKEYIRKHPDSYFSLIALKEVYGSNFVVTELEPIFNGLSESLKNSTSGKAFAKQIAIAKITSNGAIAPDFAQADVNGKAVKLSDFKGKYVLLDFWASWCGPCRAENPNVVATFHKFKDKNFTVLGISLDNPGKRADWIKAIETDQLEWTQLSDLQGWKNAVAILYGVRSVPQNFLIGPDGKIIASNLRGTNLEAKLKEVIK